MSFSKEKTKKMLSYINTIIHKDVSDHSDNIRLQKCKKEDKILYLESTFTSDRYGTLGCSECCHGKNIYTVKSFDRHGPSVFCRTNECFQCSSNEKILHLGDVYPIYFSPLFKFIRDQFSTCNSPSCSQKYCTDEFHPLRRWEDKTWIKKVIKRAGRSYTKNNWHNIFRGLENVTYV